MPTLIRCVLFFAWVALPAGESGAQAPATQGAAAIQRSVDGFLHAQTTGLPGTVRYTVGAIDPRVALPACPSLESFLPPGARLWGATTVGVRCNGSTPWTIYVTAEISVTGNYLVTTRTLAPGQPLTPVIYRSSGAIIPDLEGGHVVAGMTIGAEFIEQHRSGRLRLLAQSLGEGRWSQAPEVLRAFLRQTEIQHVDSTEIRAVFHLHQGMQDRRIPRTRPERLLPPLLRRGLVAFAQRVRAEDLQRANVIGICIQPAQERQLGGGRAVDP